jgi:hypothetical protein
MAGAWWECPSCGTPVPFAYQLEESFDEIGEAQFDPLGTIGPAPGPDEQSLAACWLRVIRCPNDECDMAWALTLYPAAKSLFDDRAIAFPA